MRGREEVEPLGVSIQAITFNLAQTVSPVRVLVKRQEFSCNPYALINGRERGGGGFVALGSIC